MFSIEPVASYTAAVRNFIAARQRVDEVIGALGKSSTVEDIAETLRNYHRRKQEVNDTWHRLSEGERRVLQPPEHYYLEG